MSAWDVPRIAAVRRPARSWPVYDCAHRPATRVAVISTDKLQQLAGSGVGIAVPRVRRRAQAGHDSIGRSRLRRCGIRIRTRGAPVTGPLLGLQAVQHEVHRSDGVVRAIFAERTRRMAAARTASYIESSMTCRGAVSASAVTAQHWAWCSTATNTAPCCLARWQAALNPSRLLASGIRSAGQGTGNRCRPHPTMPGTLRGPAFAPWKRRLGFARRGGPSTALRRTAGVRRSSHRSQGRRPGTGPDPRRSRWRGPA